MFSFDGTQVAPSRYGNVAELCALSEIRRGDLYANEIRRKKIREKGLTEGETRDA